MNGLMDIDGYKADIGWSEDAGMLRGQFVGLNGYVEFYASDVEGLRNEGRISLGVFLEACREDGSEPRKQFSGNFPVRMPSEIHEACYLAAVRAGAKSLNAWVVETLKRQANSD